ncbi:response regulator [Xylophilus sp. Kf1]|nr:response regulator [Xylophilus sp. Kf1]
MRVALLNHDMESMSDMVRLLQTIPLKEHTLACETYNSGERLRRVLRYDTFDLLILAWEMPDLPGIDLLAWLRAFQKSDTPVMLLSSAGGPGDVVRAFETGADDYASLPLQPLEFCARVSRLLLRSRSHSQGGTVVFGNWTFDRRKTSATIAAGDTLHEVALTEREFKLALALFEHLGSALSRAHLLEYSGVSPHESTSRALDSHIYRLRGKLLLEGTHGMRLMTVYGYGYRLERHG